MRRGANKVAVAVAVSMRTAIEHMLEDGTLNHDLGYNHFDRHAKEGKKN
jgi:hypothetical protein